MWGQSKNVRAILLQANVKYILFTIGNPRVPMSEKITKIKRNSK
jgi:hypothetical protein